MRNSPKSGSIQAVSHGFWKGDLHMSKLIQELIDEMTGMRVIDSHEHLPTEAELLATKADIFTRIFCHYSLTSANSAGMPEDRSVLMDTRRPLDERWSYFRPYLEAIRDNGYVRAGQITARDLYGIEQIDDTTYIELSERLQAANTEGLFSRVLKERCKIERVLNQGSWDDGVRGYSVLVSRDFMDIDWADPGTLRDRYNTWRDVNGGDFEDPESWLTCWLSRLAADGAVGLKFHASFPSECVDDKEAKMIFRKMASGNIESGESFALGVWLMHHAIEYAPIYNLIAAIHCGLVWECWKDFRDASPLNVIPLLLKYRDTTFDLYHGGIPWVREMAVIGNQYPNANLNLIWCHQISPFMTQGMLNEWIDLVPMNKIIGFGGDNVQGPEKTYGVLKMTQENIARALAIRIERGDITESSALDICRAWLYDNPRRIYRLDDR
jgi:uncharacterized protein